MTPFFLGASLALALLALAPPSHADTNEPSGTAAALDEEVERDAAKLYGGIVLTSLGGAAGATGLVLYSVFSADPAASCGDRPCADPNRGAKTASIVTTVLGLGALGVGIPLMLASERRSTRGKARPELRVGVGHVALTLEF